MTDAAIPNTDKDLLFGVIAVRRGLVTQAQVQAALREQAESLGDGPQRSLGEILVAHGFMTSRQAEQLAQYQRHAKDLPAEVVENYQKRVGPYEIIAKLGEGGMGSVLLGREGADGRLVALKILPPRLAANPVLRKRFDREIQSLSVLDHPNIVAGLCAGESDGLHFLVMEFVQGENVYQILERDGCFSARRTAEIAIQVSRALSHAAARGVTHRDIKPENIILDVHGQARVTDFGLAKHSLAVQDMHVTRSGHTVGTPYYIAPEQATGDTDAVDVRSDIYALGATMYHMVTGHVPYDGETAAVIMTRHLNDPPPWAKEVHPEVATDLCCIIHKCMAKEQERRYHRPEELRADLERFLDGRPIDAPLPEGESSSRSARLPLRPVVAAPLTPPPPVSVEEHVMLQRHRWAMALLVVVASLMVVMLMLLIWRLGG
jgi:serine/threonine-protein kinase